MLEFGQIFQRISLIVGRSRSYCFVSFAILSLKVSKSVLGTIAPVASSCPPPVAPRISFVAAFVIFSASFPLRDMFAFSGLKNATIINLSLWLNTRRFDIWELIEVLPEYVKNKTGESSLKWDSAFSICFWKNSSSWLTRLWNCLVEGFSSRMSYGVFAFVKYFVKFITFVVVSISPNVSILMSLPSVVDWSAVKASVFGGRRSGLSSINLVAKSGI